MTGTGSPLTYRVYQTATPRIYDGKRPTGNPNWIVRSMDDARPPSGWSCTARAIMEAVHNRWLSDYRIIAHGHQRPGRVRERRTILAKNTKSTGTRPS